MLEIAINERAVVKAVFSNANFWDCILSIHVARNFSNNLFVYIFKSIASKPVYSARVILQLIQPR